MSVCAGCCAVLSVGTTEIGSVGCEFDPHPDRVIAAIQAVSTSNAAAGRRVLVYDIYRPTVAL